MDISDMPVWDEIAARQGMPSARLPLLQRGEPCRGNAVNPLEDA